VAENSRAVERPVPSSPLQLGSFCNWGETYDDAAAWINTPVGNYFKNDGSMSDWSKSIADAAGALSYHMQTRLANGTQGILVDPGSIGNLGGDVWAWAVARAALEHGRKPDQVKRDRPLKVSGVGKGSEEATHNCCLPICLQRLDGSCSSGGFDLPIVKDSMLPGLLGLASLTNKRAILDLVKNQLHFLGPDDCDLASVLPPGSESFSLERAPSGHLILPCCKYKEFDTQQNRGSLRMDSAPLNLLTSGGSASTATHCDSPFRPPNAWRYPLTAEQVEQFSPKASDCESLAGNKKSKTNQ